MSLIDSGIHAVEWVEDGEDWWPESMSTRKVHGLLGRTPRISDQRIRNGSSTSSDRLAASGFRFL